MHTRAAAWTGLIVLLATTAASIQRTADERTTWNQPVEPFRIIGNIHYVGAAGVSAFLITSEDGSVLLDGGLPETAPLVVRNMSSLGFRIGDVKYLLNSHAHFDHAGGLTELRRLSGATVVASAGDAGALRAGGPNMPAVEVGRVIEDGGTVRVGTVTLTARITPGHTKGCTTWTTTATEKGRNYEVLFYCSTSVVDRLVDNAGYPEILRDYERTFAKLRALEADAFLANHPVFFDLEGKRRRLTPDANPFIDAGELRRYVDESERQFRLELRKQQSARTSGQAVR